MEQKKTISELYQECKKNVEQEELLRKQIAESFINDLIRLCSPTPIPPIPRPFQGKV